MQSGLCSVDKDGNANGFDSIWLRFIKKALIETELTEKFQEKDLRKKVASDTDLIHAVALLGHPSPEIYQAY